MDSVADALDFVADASESAVSTFDSANASDSAGVSETAADASGSVEDASGSVAVSSTSVARASAIVENASVTAGCVEVIVWTDAREIETCGAAETAGNAAVTASETPSGVMVTAGRGNEEEIANEETGRVAAT